MPVVIQKGAKPLIAAVSLTAEQVRDLLLSLPDNERKFITSDPLAGQHSLFSIRTNASGNLEYSFEA